MSAFDFLLLIFQISNKFDLNVFFQVLLNLVVFVYENHIDLLFWGPVRFTGLSGLS